MKLCDTKPALTLKKLGYSSSSYKVDSDAKQTREFLSMKQHHCKKSNIISLRSKTLGFWVCAHSNATKIHLQYRSHKLGHKLLK